MSATGWLRRRTLEIAWVVFAAVNIAAMVAFPPAETVPFHFVWISLMVVYGLRVWSPRATAAVLGSVALGTGLATLPHALAENDWVELAEVPLMAAMFGVMVVYARRRQAALAVAHRAAEGQREFLRDASHQLRTPITVARGHAELLAMNLPDGPHREDLDIVVDELTTLGRMAQNLLTLDAVTRTHAARRDPVDVQHLLQRAGRRWSVTADRRWYVTAPADTTVAGDAQRLEAALDALIENAVVATGDGDEIALVARAEEGGVVIEVWDSGSGIPLQDAERVFDRFRRLEGSPAGGSGLGLSIVRAIAESHGGHVCVAPSAGGGATLRMTLPRPAPVP